MKTFDVVINDLETTIIVINKKATGDNNNNNKKLVLFSIKLNLYDTFIQLALVDYCFSGK